MGHTHFFYLLFCIVGVVDAAIVFFYFIYPTTLDWLLLFGFDASCYDDVFYFSSYLF
jgi:hypothetical protein